MDHSGTFARLFARLVWLLLREPANVDEQKVTLRALVTMSRMGAVRMEMRQGTITANDLEMPAPLPGVTELRERMTALGVRAVEADAGAAAADLLAAARRLAEVAGAAPGPTVRLVSGLVEHVTAARHAAGSPAALLETLDGATGATLLTRLLDELVRAAETAVRQGDVAMAVEIFHRIVWRERRAQDADARRAFMLVIRRLSRSAVLRAVAQRLVRAPQKREQELAVLTRTGEDGADALIDQLVRAEERSERRVYFDALLELRAGVPTLLHMLGDPRWFVARNAAALLGELKAPEAEQPLSELLHHDDERVRHAATIALMRLGTSRSMPAIEQALHDGAPQIRMQAAALLVERRAEAKAEPLIRALETEKDDEVKAAFYLALGRFGTREAVERLIAAAQPERGLFRKKPMALRIAALQALAMAGTPTALDALVELQGDRERDVQQAAVAALEEKVRVRADVGTSGRQDAGRSPAF